jgi:hypothetical protein
MVRVRRFAAVVVIFSAGLAMGLWLQRPVDAQLACLEHIRSISAPKSPMWQQ